MTDVSPKGLYQVIAIVLVVAVAWNLIGNLVLPGAWYVPANVAVAAGLIALARSAGIGWGELGLGHRWVRRGALVGLGAALLIGAVIALGVATPSIRTFFESDRVAMSTPGERWFAVVIRIPIGTAVFEEIVFRSVLLGALLQLTSVRRAVILSAVAFGLWHVVPAWESATGGGLETLRLVVGTVAATTVAGVGFALLRTWSKSIVAPILAHAATNSFAYVAAVVVLDLVD